jgi:hypothetical protein
MSCTPQNALHIETGAWRWHLVFWFAVLVLPWPASGQLQSQPVWTRTVGDGPTSVSALALDAAGNIHVAGAGGHGYLTAKLSPDGNVLWSASAAGRVGLGACNAIAVDGAGGVYVTGGLPGARSYVFTYCDFFDGCQEYRHYSPDLVTIKYDDRGRRKWEARYFETEATHFWGMDVVVDPGGDVYVVGYTLSIPAAGAIYVTGTRTLKYNPAGGLLWVRTNSPINTTYLQNPGNLASLDRAGNLCLTGAAGTRKLDPTGNELWNVPIQGAVLRLDNDGHVYVATDEQFSSTTTKITPDGNVVWTAPFGGRAMTLDSAANAFLADFRLRPSQADYVTTKLDPQGRPIWRAFNDISSGSEYPTDLAADDHGNVYVTGYSGTVKYDASGMRIWQMPPTYGFSQIALDASGDFILAGVGTDGFVITKLTETLAPGAPVIPAQPHHPLVRAGDTVTLSVDAVGDTPLVYQWRNVTGLIRDATNATLILTGIQTNQTGLYSVEVTNHAGSVAASGIFVNLLEPLPSQVVVQGATASFIAPVVGGGPAAFQWQFNGVNLPLANNPTLLITNAGLAQAGNYSLVVSNHYGNALTSTVGRLTVDARVTQTWAATVPNSKVGDLNQALGVDAAGNVFVTGYSGCGHKTVKYDASGRELWQICDGNYDSLGGLVVDAAGNVAIAGGSFVWKYSAAGSLLWVSPFDNDPASSNQNTSAITVDLAGNFYVAGHSLRGTNGYDFITVKYDPAGRRLWTARYDGPTHADDVATAIAVDHAGKVSVSGASAGANLTYEFAVVRYDSAGAELWVNRYNGPGAGDDVPSDIVVDGTGNLWVTGWSPGEPGKLTDFATIRYDASGRELWVARYNGPRSGEDNPHGLAVDSAGNSYVSGSSMGSTPPGLPSAARSYDIATVKYGPDGRELWAQRYSGPANRNDYSRALALDAAGNVYIQGHSDSSPNRTTEVVTLSYDSAGHPRWIARYETGVEVGSDYRNGSIAVDAAGIVYVADTSFLGGIPSYLTLKYTQNSMAPVSLAAPVLTSNGRLGCVLTGQANSPYAIQVSSDLVDWRPLTNVVTTVAGTGEFTDEAPAAVGQKFYRAVQP